MLTSVLTIPPVPPAFVFSLSGFAMDVIFWYLVAFVLLQATAMVHGGSRSVGVEKETVRRN
jgi:hypothetical protein